MFCQVGPGSSESISRVAICLFGWLDWAEMTGWFQPNQLNMLLFEKLTIWLALDLLYFHF